jgi:hypothetical protein
MGTASIHEGVRRMRFSSLLDRTESKELTQEAVAELLGINVRTFQRWAVRFEAESDPPACLPRRTAAFGFDSPVTGFQGTCRTYTFPEAAGWPPHAGDHFSAHPPSR